MPVHYHFWFTNMPIVPVTVGVVTGLVLYLLTALWFGSVMERKGRSRILGILLVIFLGFIGMIIVLLYPGLDTSHRLRRRGPADYNAGIGKGLQLQQDGSLTSAGATRACPHCGSRVPLDDAICRVCHQALLTRGG